MDRDLLAAKEIAARLRTELDLSASLVLAYDQDFQQFVESQTLRRYLNSPSPTVDETDYAPPDPHQLVGLM